MRISVSVVVVLVAALGLVGVLYCLPKVVVNNKKPVTSTANRDVSPQNTPKQEATTDHSTLSRLTDLQQKEVNVLSRNFISATDNETKVKAATSLSDLYSQAKRFDSAAIYAEKVALLKPTALTVIKAADRFYDAFGFATDEKRQNELGEKTREWYQKALDKNPNLLGAKANMAMTYVATPNPMQGILLLREVLATDPTNELATFNLGLLSMRSNQYTKAVERFRQIIKTNPNNTKAQFYLGVSLAQLGQNKEALEVLKLVKDKEKDPAIQAAVRELEQELK